STPVRQVSAWHVAEKVGRSLTRIPRAMPAATSCDSGNLLLLDNDKPCSDDRSLWAAAASTRCRRWRRSCRRCGSGTALRLEQVHVVRVRINRDRLCAGKCIDRRYDAVFIGRVLMDDCDVALASIGNVDQFFRCIPSQSVNTRAVLDGRDDFARVRINNDGGIVATGENAVGRFVISDACRSFAWVERP